MESIFLLSQVCQESDFGGVLGYKKVNIKDL